MDIENLAANVCRICLRSDITLKYNFHTISEDYQSIFATKHDILNLTAVDVFDKVCYVCHSLVKRYCAFTRACRESQYMLEELVIGNIQKLPKCMSFITLTLKNQESTSIPEQPDTSNRRNLNGDVYYKPDLDIKVDSQKEITGTRNSPYETEIYFDNLDELTAEAFDLDDEDTKPLKLLKTEKSVRKKKRKGKLKVSRSRHSGCSYIPDPNILHVTTKRMILDSREFTVRKLNKDEMLAEFEGRKNAIDYIKARYKCDKCYKNFTSAYYLMEHNKQRHTKSENNVQCQVCRQYYPSVGKLRIHLRAHTYRYQCKLCEYVVASKRQILSHYGNRHDRIKQFLCKECGKCFTSDMNRRDHEKRHRRVQNTGIFICDYCGRNFKLASDIARHIWRLHSGNGVKCELCKKVFMTANKLSTHTCRDSRQTRPRQARQTSGVAAGGQDERLYCVECDRRFNTHANLLRHYNTKKHGAEPLHECPQCELKFYSPTQRTDHINRDHLHKSYLCPHCGETQYTANGHANHIAFKHDNKQRPEKKFQCAFCGHKFFSRGHLNRHVNIHTGARPFKCTLCDKAFASDATLYGHIKIVHHKIKRKRSYVPKSQRNKQTYDKIQTNQVAVSNEMNTNL